MLRTIGVFFLAASAMSGAVAQTTIAQDARLFGKRESAWSVDISPGGTKAVMLMSGPAGVTVAKVVDLATGSSKNILGSRDSKESLSWCQFASDSYLVCKYSGVSRVDGQLLPFSRLISIASDGSKMTPLGQKASDRDRGLRQFDGRIVDWLPNEPGSVLMAREYVAQLGNSGNNLFTSRAGLGVDRIDIAENKVTQVETPRDSVADYMTDGRGNVRIQVLQGVSDGRLTGRMRYKYRRPGSRDWEDLGESGVSAASDIYPIAVEGQGNSVFVLKQSNGRDALYRIALDGSKTMTLVASNPKVDIDGVVRLGKGQKVVGYTFTDASGEVRYFDSEIDKLTTSLGKALPKTPLMDISGSSADGQKMLIFAGSDAHPGTYYVLDRATKKMQELALVRPDLEARALASVKAITYKAADGKDIPAYVTMPAGASGKNMPAVVLPHGGPASRDQWGFDWLPQFFAARGYVVIQPNYRGSSGYGADFQNKNAFYNWKQAIADIGDSARYLASAGIADPKRIAIVGWSYGGYAALQSAVVEPSLYKAAVAIAPVTDFDLVKKEAENFTNVAIVRELVGTGPHVAEGSPLRHVERIQVPVLLFHGDYDLNVGVQQSEKMESALKRAGKKVEFVKYEGLDHQLDDSNARGDMLNRIGIALEAAIGR